MVCVAAFIVLCLMSVFVLFLSIFKRDLGQKYWKIFKKAWGCVWKKIRLQKCESDFKNDVKNSILKHVILKKPQLVKPIAVAIEVVSVLIVVISLWSVIEASKAGLSLLTMGTCNVSTPSSCKIGAEACAIDRDVPNGFGASVKRWLGEWGEIFISLPDSFKRWKVEDYILDGMPILTRAHREAPLALDIIDPLCHSCVQTLQNQEKDDFLKKHNVVMMFYPIMKDENEAKFHNSDLIVRFLYAISFYEKIEGRANRDSVATKIMRKIALERNEHGIDYQRVFAYDLSNEDAEKLLVEWIKGFEIDDNGIAIVQKLAKSEEMSQYLAKVREIVEKKIHVRGIPTLIYDGRKHFGAYKGEN